MHEKVDDLISRQWRRLSEIQQAQIEMLHQGRRHNKIKTPKAIDDGQAKLPDRSSEMETE